MDNCRAIQDLILTDYTDGEMDSKTAQEIEAHLKQCAECRRFSKEVKAAAASFQNIPRAAVPPHLWNSIKEKIEQESRLVPKKSLSQRLLDAFAFPYFVPSLAALMLAFLISTVLIGKNALQQVQTNEEEEDYLVYLFDENNGDFNDLPETPIETYFL